MNKKIHKITREFVEWTKRKVRLHLQGGIDFYFKEREIWWASLGKNIGFEQDGKNEKFERPVLVLKKFNKEILWALPMTSKPKKGIYYFKIEHDEQEYNLILSQLRLISSKRLTRKIRTLNEDEFKEVRDKIKDFL